MRDVATHEHLQQVQLYLARLGGPELELLRRCALLRAFDEDVVAVLAQGLDKEETPSLDALAGHAFVLRVRGRKGVHRLREDARRALMESWWDGQPAAGVPEELEQLSGVLTEKLAVVPAVDKADIVMLRLFAGRNGALAEWKALFQEADDRFDLLRCQALLGVLAWPAAVSSDLEAEREDRQTYLDARSLWMDAWYRTGAFVLPDRSREVFDGLLRGDAGRMLELQGYGGYGKTSHIRWLIAHRAVHGTPRIPCACVDFDVVDPVAATRDPYLVFLEMAEQLNVQLAGEAFGKLLRGHGVERSRLYRRERVTSVTGRDVKNVTATATDEETSADVMRRFTARLAELGDDPVVLILDTLEEALHLPKADGRPAIQPVLEALALAQREAPGLRIVLSGRYDLGDGLRALFADRCEKFELPRFSEDEAHEYLVEQRFVRNDAQVKAATTASECVPFSLALLADLIDQDPTIAPARIEAYKGAEYAYLIERVVQRIDEQPVRWVLRYAAIPRRFDYEFTRDVIWPRVREGMAGVGELDDPDADDLPAAEDEKAPPWAVGDIPPAEEAAVRQVWAQVTGYANGSSWIAADAADPEALRLQPEVVRPLRGLLRSRGIVPAMHEDAVRYFLQRAAGAATDGQADRRGVLMREAIFHRFQLEGAAAGSWWEEQLATAGDAELRFTIADELARGSDYSDRGGKPLPWGDGGLVSEEILQRARLELCLESAELATLEAPAAVEAELSQHHVLWQTAVDALDRFEAFPDGALPSGRIALARAAVKLRRDGPAAARADVRAALTQPGPSAGERLWIAVLEARRLVAEGAPEASARLEAADELAAAAPNERDLRRLLALGVSQYHSAWGAFDRAIDACVRATEAGLGSAEFQLTEARYRLECGDAETARRVATEVGSVQAAPVAFLQARGLRLQHRFEAAAAAARRAIAALDTSPGTFAVASWVRGYALIECGEAAAALLDAEQARAVLAEALRAFDDDDNHDAAADCHLREAVLMMRGLGQLRAAGVSLDYADRIAPPGSRAAVRALLLRAELSARLEDFEGAAKALKHAVAIDPLAERPQHAAEAAFASMAYGGRRDREANAERLATCLAPVSPPSARLQLLAGIERGPVLKSQSKAAKRLRELVVPEGGWTAELAPLAPRDRALLQLRAAALARLMGDQREADQLLGLALSELCDGDESPVELLEVVRLARLLRAPELITNAGSAALAAARRMADEHPLLAAVTLIEYMEAALETGADGNLDAPALCREAEALLERVGPGAEAWWARLAELYATADHVDRETTTAYLKAAVGLFEAGGDARRAAQVRGRVGGDDADPDDDDAVVAVNVALAGEAIKARSAGWRLPRLKRTSASTRLRNLIGKWVATAGSEPYPLILPDLIVGDWPTFKSAMGEVVDAADVRRRRRRWRGEDRTELLIRVRDGVLQALPWELASDLKDGDPLYAGFRRAYRAPPQMVADTRIVRVVQAGLNVILGGSLPVDGVSGPDTARALGTWDSHALPTPPSVDDPETVQRLHAALLRGEQPRVVIARPAAGEGRRRNPGLSRRYARAGFATAAVDDAYTRVLATLLRTEPPPVVVHVVGGLVAAGGATAIDLEDVAWSWRPRDDGALLTAADLDRALHMVPPDWPAPVIVLDVPLPSGRREAADQLLLRNCFAAELFAMGATRAVVATGLAGARSADVAQDVLVEGLARGDAIADVVQAMRREGPERAFSRFDTAAAFAATALWTSDGGMRLPASGRS